MRHDDEQNTATVSNLLVGMFEAARNNRIFTNGSATRSEMYLMAVEVSRSLRFVHNMPEWPDPQAPA